MNDSPRTNLFRLLAVVSVALSLVCVQPSVRLAAGHSDDLVWHEVISGTVSAWILNGSRWVAGTRELDWRCAEECSAEWYPIAMGDFNGDGAQDLWWHNHRPGLVAAWLLNGGTVVAGSGLLTEWCGVSDGCAFQVPIGISH